MVGVLYLSEEYLHGCDVMNIDHPVLKQISRIISHAGDQKFEKMLNSYFSERKFQNVTSNVFNGAISIVVVWICTKTSLFEPSLFCCCRVLVPVLSELMSNPDTKEWDVGSATTSLISKLKKFNVESLKRELENNTALMHPDLEDILNKYVNSNDEI